MNRSRAIKSAITLLTGMFIFILSFASVKLTVDKKSNDFNTHIFGRTIVNKTLSISSNHSLAINPTKEKNKNSLKEWTKTTPTPAKQLPRKKTSIKQKHQLEIKKIELALQTKKESDKKINSPQKQQFTLEEIRLLPETALDITLISSFISPRPEENIATIANTDAQRRYKIDQLLTNQNKIKLVAIMGDSVILNNNGKIEKLLMYPTNKSPATSAATLPESNYIGEEGDDITDDLPSLVIEELSPSEKLAVVNQRLGKIEDVIKLSIKNENGELLGFKVMPGNNRAAFEKSELQKNDIITAIDGTELENIRIAQQTWAEKRHSSQADFTILRNDALAVVSVDIGNF